MRLEFSQQRIAWEEGRLQIDPHEYSAKHACEETTQGQAKKHPKILERTIHGTQQGW